MATTLFVQKDNGDLKFIAEVEDIDNPALALDAVLDEGIRAARGVEEFVAVVGSLEDGVVVTLTVAGEDIVQPRRAISVSSDGVVPAAAKPKRAQRRQAPKPPVEPVEDEPAEEAPKPKRNTRKAKAPAAKSPKATTAAKAKPAKAAKKAKKTPFTRNPASDE